MRHLEKTEPSGWNAGRWSAAVALISGTLSLAFVVTAQQIPPRAVAQPSAEEVQRLISRIEKGNFNERDVIAVGREHLVQAVPALETQFDRSKEKIAFVVLQLGEKNDKYWDYLALRAREALRDGPPTPFIYDANGKVLQGESPKLLEWAKRHGRSPGEAYEDATFKAAVRFLWLARLHDERAIPILREALTSNNDLS